MCFSNSLLLIVLSVLIVLKIERKALINLALSVFSAVLLSKAKIHIFSVRTNKIFPHATQGCQSQNVVR